MLKATCRNTTNYPIGTFTAQWIVPDEPATNGQTLFVFIGITTPNDLIQCVLQWGGSIGGGGQNWSIGCQQITNGYGHIGNPNVDVAVGDLITARIRLLGQKGQAFGYQLEITNGIVTVGMNCTPIIAPRDCSVALEIIAVDSPDELPPVYYTLVEHINIQTSGGALPLNWNPYAAPNDKGIRLAIPNPDRIALWYHQPPTNPNTIIA